VRSKPGASLSRYGAEMSELEPMDAEMDERVVSWTDVFDYNNSLGVQEAREFGFTFIVGKDRSTISD
jgi:hypothetical protein